MFLAGRYIFGVPQSNLPATEEVVFSLIPFYAFRKKYLFLFSTPGRPWVSLTRRYRDSVFCNTNKRVSHSWSIIFPLHFPQVPVRSWMSWPSSRNSGNVQYVWTRLSTWCSCHVAIWRAVLCVPLHWPSVQSAAQPSGIPYASTCLECGW